MSEWNSTDGILYSACSLNFLALGAVGVGLIWLLVSCTWITVFLFVIDTHTGNYTPTQSLVYTTQQIEVPFIQRRARLNMNWYSILFYSLEIAHLKYHFELWVEGDDIISLHTWYHIILWFQRIQYYRFIMKNEPLCVILELECHSLESHTNYTHAHFQRYSAPNISIFVCIHTLPNSTHEVNSFSFIFFCLRAVIS